MKRGPKPIPDSFKVIQGTFRKDRSNPDQPDVQPGLPTRPAWLKGKERIALWDELVQLLNDAYIITPMDGFTLAQYVDLYCWMQEQRKAKIMPPASYHSQLYKLAAMFGLDPSSRSQIKRLKPIEGTANTANAKKYFTGVK